MFLMLPVVLLIFDFSLTSELSYAQLMEIIASPEIFIAAAAERTKHIKLGTGVISVGYHNPLWIAERIVQLDHMTRGRVMLGVGPGSLPTDAAMIGVDQSETRDLLEQGFDVVVKLLRGEEPVNFKNHRWDLRNAHLHLRPYSDPLFDMAVAAVASAAGRVVVRAAASPTILTTTYRSEPSFSDDPRL